jgi:hypothetical protein
VTTLHVTNGDCAADALRAAGVRGTVVPWRDVLHEGPVPAGLSLSELGAARAAWMAEQGWGAADFRERDATLAGFAAHDETVLWFEHDLYDQLQLIQVADWLAEHAPAGAPVSLVNPPEYLGPAAPERIAALFAERRALTGEQRDVARRAWAAFRAPDPTAIERVLAGGTGALPFLAAALRRHLEQFPAARDGLSRSERQALEAVADGATTPEAAFAEHNRREDPVWLGDSTFLGYLRALASGPDPLLRMEGGLRLTATGRAVLDGRADRVRANGIRRWLGGVHLHGPDARWRWDGAAGRLIEGSSLQ